jgi:hypothetical protein
VQQLGEDDDYEVSISHDSLGHGVQLLPGATMGTLVGEHLEMVPDVEQAAVVVVVGCESELELADNSTAEPGDLFPLQQEPRPVVAGPVSESY